MRLTILTAQPVQLLYLLFCVEADRTVILYRHQRLVTNNAAMCGVFRYMSRRVYITYITVQHYTVTLFCLVQQLEK